MVAVRFVVGGVHFAIDGLVLETMEWVSGWVQWISDLLHCVSESVQWISMLVQCVSRYLLWVSEWLQCVSRLVEWISEKKECFEPENTGYWRVLGLNSNLLD